MCIIKLKVDDVNYSALANIITVMTKPKGSKEYYKKLIDRRTVAKGMKYLKEMNFRKNRIIQEWR